ncbi:MAG: glycosyltransferase [Candidatus Ratteibacteria bacterium]|nr:glycosyltransferase [Candidatus Ratteibacteria bacterium]
MSHIFVSPLSWGLGHATRDIPIIKELLKHGHKITIASSGSALALLQKEFPACEFLYLPDYPTPYSGSVFFVAKFTAYIPLMLHAIRREEQKAHQIFKQNKYDLIIADNRFGVYSSHVPSFFISHQLRFSAPRIIPIAEQWAQSFNSRFHKNFTRVIVPDNSPDTVSLSGKLSVNTRKSTLERIYYAGILSSIKKLDMDEDIDFLFSVSGPEPQRTMLERKVMEQVQKLPGKKMVLLGKPAENKEYKLDELTTVKSHAGREEMSVLMNRAKFIISRSGYTTVMEIAELGKKKCLFIPTPGQTEQVYLSEYYMEKGWFYSKSQYSLDIVKDIEEAKKYSGLPPMSDSQSNAEKLYKELFAPYLETM